MFRIVLYKPFLIYVNLNVLTKQSKSQHDLHMFPIECSIYVNKNVVAAL